MNKQEPISASSLPYKSRSSLIFIHCLLTWVMAWWTFALALPGDLLATAKAYHLFLQLLPEDGWTALFGVVTLFGLSGICVPRVRLLSAHVLSAMHALVFGLIAMANPFSTAVGPYCGMAVAGYFFLWQQHHTLKGPRP